MYIAHMYIVLYIHFLSDKIFFSIGKSITAFGNYNTEIGFL